MLTGRDAPSVAPLLAALEPLSEGGGGLHDFAPAAHAPWRARATHRGAARGRRSRGRDKGAEFDGRAGAGAVAGLLSRDEKNLAHRATRGKPREPTGAPQCAEPIDTS